MLTYSRSETRWLGLLAIMTLAVITISLWLPYGFNIAGWGDEWPILTYADAGGALVAGTLRPFLYVPYTFAYWLTPDSFMGMNIILAIMTFGRGAVMYVLLRRLLPENAAVALIGGALTVVYPGDVAFYALVSVSITTALVFLLVAWVALVAYWQRPRWYHPALMGAALAFSVGIYEASYPLIMATPLLLVYLAKGFNWRVIRVSVLWYIIPVVYVLVNLVSQAGNRSVGGYQVSVISSDNSLGIILSSFAEVYIREFWRIWQWASLGMPQGFSDGRTWLTLAVTLIVGIALWRHRPQVGVNHSSARFVVILLGGLAVVGIGYFLFAFTSYRADFFRTLFYGLPGAAVAMSLLIWVVSHSNRFLRWALAVVLAVIAISYFTNTQRLSALLVFIIGIGFLVKAQWRYTVIGACVVGIATSEAIGFHKTQPFADLPGQQQQLVTSIIQQAPAVKPHTRFILTGAPGTKEQYEVVRNRYDILQAILQFVYKRHDIQAQLCMPDGVSWGEYNTRCELRADGAYISFSDTAVMWSYEKILVFAYQPPNGIILLDQIPAKWMTKAGVTAYAPHTLIDKTAPLPYRLQTVWSGEINK